MAQLFSKKKIVKTLLKKSKKGGKILMTVSSHCLNDVF